MPQLTSVPPITSEGSESPPEESQKARARTTRALPTDRIAFPRQLDVLRGFAVAAADNGGSASNNNVAPLVSMSHHTIALSNSFFVEAGFMTRTAPGRFAPAAGVVEYSRAHSWTPTTATHRLAPIVSSSWFGQLIARKVSVQARNAEEIMSDLAGEAGASPEHRPQIELLIEFAVASGIVERDGQTLKQATPTAARPEITTDAAPAADIPEPAPRKRGVTTAFMKDDTSGGVSFDVSVHVSMSDFAGWRPERISAFFGGIAAVLAAKGRMEEDAGSG
jgi:hypothetical protein